MTLAEAEVSNNSQQQKRKRKSKARQEPDVVQQDESTGVEEAAAPVAEESASDTEGVVEEPVLEDGAVADQDQDAADVDGEVATDQEATESTADEPQVNFAVLEALLFSTHHPLTAGRLAELLDLGSTKPVRNAIRDLNQSYEETGRSFRIDQVAGGYQLLTLPEYHDVLQKMHQREADTKLTKSALETLAIIAYKQPILRADVEAIRGVACGETIRSLMEKHLVKIAGRAELPGRPILYGTTKRFLELFGLNSLKDLPQQELPLQSAGSKPAAEQPAVPVEEAPPAAAE